MVGLLISSVGIKAISAVLEICIQMIITQTFGIVGYGNYSFYVNAIEMAFWLLFSGIIKCNTFYLADDSVSISRFKKHYYLRYVLPILVCFSLITMISHEWIYLLSVGGLALFFRAYDQSSEFLARKQEMTSLLGEYLIGRLVFVVLLGAFIFFKVEQVAVLITLYSLQYGIIILWFTCRSKTIRSNNREEIPVKINKLWQYQQSDIAYGLIGQSPVILQYLSVGAYEAGFAGIVVVVKRLVNFISGPTAKIFLPEFSRLYQQGNISKIRSFYLLIIQIQMLFVSVIAVALIGFSELILRMFSPELAEHTMVFQMVSVGFLLVASLGPGAGLMQMTGQEKTENHMRWITIALMFFVWFVMRENRFFAIYGLCAQAISEGLIKYFFVCRWFKKAPISIWRYGLLWLPAIIICISIHLLKLSENYLALFLSCGLCFISTGFILIMQEDVRHQLMGMLPNDK